VPGQIFRYPDKGPVYELRSIEQLDNETFSLCLFTSGGNMYGGNFTLIKHLPLGARNIWIEPGDLPYVNSNQHVDGLWRQRMYPQQRPPVKIMGEGWARGYMQPRPSISRHNFK